MSHVSYTSEEIQKFQDVISILMDRAKHASGDEKRVLKSSISGLIELVWDFGNLPDARRGLPVGTVEMINPGDTLLVVNRGSDWAIQIGPTFVDRSDVKEICLGLAIMLANGAKGGTKVAVKENDEREPSVVWVQGVDQYPPLRLVQKR